MIKGSINLKTILILVILVLVGVLGVLGINTARTYIGSAAAGVEPKNVTAKPEAVTNGDKEEQVATIVWTTEKAAMSVVEYGTTPASLLLRAAEAEQTTSHGVKLSPLKANTSYYFRIKVGEEIFDNNGIPYSFKTKASLASEVMPTGVVAEPTVAVVPTAGEGCNRSTDYNSDGTINSLDYMVCMSRGGIKTPTPTIGTGCKPGTDYDGNGVVNSLDMMKCLQSKR